MHKPIAAAALAAVFGFVAATTSAADESAYLDDRSTPEQVIRSYFNAIGSGQYGRAVSYFGASSAPADYDAWWRSFEPVRNIELAFGLPHHDSRAGWIAYSVPVAATFEAFDGQTWVEAGCVGVYQELPNGEQPFVPMSIGPVTLERQPVGNPLALPACDD